MTAKSLMIQGTTSDAGKSTIAAGLCRALVRRGYSVAPFKPQNMALNSAVTIDGGEIGRAQWLQALACGIPPHSDMNPVLLKPSSDKGSQVIVQGKVFAEMDARKFHSHKKELMPFILESHARLAQQYDFIVVEGAGSPAEINLRANDLANMGFAEAIDCPVLIVADIERGGVFAHLAGTVAVFSESEKRRVKGFIINRFRGDASLLDSGIEWLERETGVPNLAVVPYIKNLVLDPEDSLSGPSANAKKLKGSRDESIASPRKLLKVVVLKYPRASNESDFVPLSLHPGVELTFVSSWYKIPPADLIILPGSKHVVEDLRWLIAGGFDAHLKSHLRYGGKVVGVCGGFQMLGQAILDPHGAESSIESTTGLGLLDVSTTMEQHKTLRNVTGRLNFSDTPKVTGYEIHLGATTSTSMTVPRPAVLLDDRHDGIITGDDQIMGTYIHGLFDESDSMAAVLRWAGLESNDFVDMAAERERSIDLLSQVVEQHLDMRRIENILRG